MQDKPVIDIHQHMFKAKLDDEGKPIRDRATKEEEMSTRVLILPY